MAFIPPKLLSGGLWRHYNGGVYRVLGIATHSESLQPLVVYKDTKNVRQLWARPMDMFLEWIVTPAGVQKPRFEKLGLIGAKGNFKKKR